MKKTSKTKYTGKKGGCKKTAGPQGSTKKTSAQYDSNLASQRPKAEARLKEQIGRLEELSGQDAKEIIHELEAYQVELEMQNEELRRAQVDLEESRHRYVDLYDFAPVGYFTLNPKGIITSVNLTGAAMLGTTRKELVKKRFSVLMHEDDADTFNLYVRRIIQEEVRQTIVARLKKKDGAVVHVQLESIAIRDDAGSVYEIRATATDIKDHVEAEETIRQLARFPAENPYPVLRISSDGVIIYANDASNALLDSWGCKIGEQLPEKFSRLVIETHSSKTFKEIEYTLGDRILSLNLVPISGTNFINIYGIDITDRKVLEGKIQQAKKEWERTFDTLPDLIAIMDKDHTILRGNRSLAERVGLSPKELVGKKYFSIMHGTSAPLENCPHSLTLDDGREHSFEFKDNRFGGYLLVSTTPLFDSLGNLGGVIHVSRDITELKHAEQALREVHKKLEERHEVTTEKLKESEFKYSTLVEALLTGVYIHTEDKLMFVNKQITEMFGYNKDELLNMSILNLIHAEDREAFIIKQKETISREDEEIEFEVRGVKKNGDVIYLLGKNTQIDYINHKAFLGNITDISKRKLAEKKLRRAQINYRIIADYTYDWEWWTNLDGTLRYVSPACERITGYKADQFIENDSLLREIIIPEDRDKWDKHDNQSNKDIGLREMQIRIKRPDGEVRWIEHACQPVFTRENEFLGFRASNRDITERKQAEEALRENRKRLIKAEQVAHMGFLDWNLKTNEIILSREVCALYGIEPGMLTAVEQITEMLHPDDTEFVKENLRLAIKGSREYNIDHRMVRPDGKVIWVHARADLELDKDGRPASLIGTVIDITERKLAEQKLQESEVNLVKAQEVAHIGSWNLDLLDNKLIWTDENYRIFGIPKGTPLTYEKFLEIVHPEDRDYVDEKWHAAIKGELYDIEHRLLIDNELKWVRERAELMFDDKGNPISGVGITQDITDRKLAEISMQKNKEVLSALSAQLLSAEEKERKRIANDIHDGVGQALSAIKFSVENSLSSLTEESSQAARNTLNNIVPLTQQTIEEVRKIVMDLRPSILDDLGLKATVSWFCREFEAIYTDISIEQALNFEESNISAPLKTVIYRIMQEAFNNAAKHSRTDVILIRLENTTDNLELLIEDKGMGFDVNEVELREINRRGVGLASMRERAGLSGGTFDIKSGLREGTRIYVSWPTAAISIDREKNPAE